MATNYHIQIIYRGAIDGFCPVSLSRASEAQSRESTGQKI